MPVGLIYDITCDDLTVLTFGLAVTFYPMRLRPYTLHKSMYETIILPYTAVCFSIIARIIFMYLLYSKKSTNIYSLTFCCLSVISSSIWIPYGAIIGDTPIIVRSCIEIILLSSSGVYILRNRCYAHHARVEDAPKPLDTH
jgi:uncharacterized protein with PQ loop repeat